MIWRASSAANGRTESVTATMTAASTERLFIFQCLNKRTTHRGFRRPQRGDERRSQNDRNQQRERVEREMVIEPKAGDVATHDLQKVEKIHGAERAAYDNADTCDAQRLDPDRSPNLAVQPA